MPVEPGQRLSHYRLAEKLGEGGMGVVYLAHDERLNRPVAVKVLPAGTLEDKAARKQFRREALALSRLNHPNIETIHYFDSDGGVDFLVMEYVAGRTLDEMLIGGPLSERDIVLLGSQIAAGLAAAHAEGVVHRDLKPANLRVTNDGRVKLLDFGLAKWLQDPEQWGTTLSLVGSEGGAGTLPYMAPEQLRKEGIDLRSDVYAFGAVLYEMATGRRPFPQTSPPRLIEAILNEAPVPPSTINPRVSPALESIILKAQDKDPGRRYQTAREIQVDLERLGAGQLIRAAPSRHRRARGLVYVGSAVMGLVLLAIGLNVGGVRGRLLHGIGPGRISSIAVLPLANLSGDPGQEYFADGMTDELITSLAQIRSLRVISRTSVMQYKGTTQRLPTIAKELGAQAVVEGSVRRVGGRVRVTAQLIEASTDEHLWADSFERETRDVLFLQADLSQAIAGAIRAVLTPGEKARLSRARPVSPEAYEAYLRGRSHGAKFTGEEMKKAVNYLEDAVARQPDYALAYAELSRDYWHLGQPLGGMPYREAMEKARAAATRALALDGTLGEAYSALGTIRLWYDWNAIEAEKLIKRATELTPGDAFAHMQYSFLLVSTERPEAAIAEGKRAVEISPLDLILRVGLAETLYLARRYDESIQEARKMIALDPTFRRAYVELVRNYEATGRYDSAAAALGQLWILTGDSRSGEDLRRAWAASGKEGYFRWLMEHGGRSWVRLAQLGRIDEAIDGLEQAYSQRRGDLIFLHVLPFPDPVRSDPRFQDLVRRIGIQPSGERRPAAPNG